MVTMNDNRVVQETEIVDHVSAIDCESCIG